MRRWMKVAFCIACVSAGIGVASLGTRSFYLCDMLHFGGRSKGDANDGSSWFAWIYSTRGSIRFNINRKRWHYVTEPNPFPGDDPMQWLVGQAEPMMRVPPWFDRVHPRTGTTSVSRGIDFFGFGAGHYLAQPSAAGSPDKDWTIRKHTAVRFPHAVLALLLLMPPAFLFWRWWRTRRRIKRGLCEWCGYDLRSSPGCCPECGKDRRMAETASGATIAHSPTGGTR